MNEIPLLLTNFQVPNTRGKRLRDGKVFDREDPTGRDFDAPN